MLLNEPPPPPPPTSEAAALAIRTPCRRPQLHTRKNHDAYNGILHIPLSTHVQTMIATTTTSTSTERSRSYLVTLYYPANRACELRRSDADVLALRRGLATAGCAAAPRTRERSGSSSSSSSSGSSGSSGSGSGSESSGRSRSRSRSRSSSGSGSGSGRKKSQKAIATTAAAAGGCACSCSCCRCPCGSKGADARLAREVIDLLREALDKVGEGNGPVRPVIERFLRRRIGDCAG
ncbi:hypothetical protein VTG60DRAFT_7222 [Thermothelomyces hinnuleus]